MTLTPRSLLLHRLVLPVHVVLDAPDHVDEAAGADFATADQVEELAVAALVQHDALKNVINSLWSIVS